MPPDTATTWTLLRTRPDFRRLYLAQIVSQGGDWFTMIPLIVLLQKLTGNGALGALLLAIETIIIASLSLYAGSTVDRYPRRHIAVISQAGCAVGIIPLLFLHSAGTAWLGLLSYGLLAIGKAFFTPAASALVPDLVSPPELLTASTAINALWGIMLALGASAGGIAAALTSPHTCFLVTLTGYAASALVLTRLQPAHRSTVQHTLTPASGYRAFIADIREVAHECRTRRPLPQLLFSKPCTHLGNGAIALFPALVIPLSDHPEIAASILYAARGIGAMLGPLTGRYLARRIGFLRPPLITAMLIFSAGYALVPQVNSVFLAFLLVTLAHVGGSMNAGLSGYGLQAYTPPTMRGRVFAVDNMIAMLAIALSQLTVSVGLTLASSATVMSACAGVVALSALLWAITGRRLPLAVNP